MPVDLEGVVTDIGRQLLMEGWGQTTPLAAITNFKVGEGGWQDLPAGRFPRDATDPGPGNNRGPVLTDLDAILNPADYPADSQATFTKALVGLDFSLSGNTVLEVTCTLDAGDFNDDGFGNFPEIYEIGLFDSTGDMVVYATCPVVVKTPIPRTFIVRIQASRS